RREVVEPRVFLLEEQLHGAGGPIALLPDDQLGEPLETLAGLGVGGAVVELLAVDEAHDVGVLLDGARLPEVGELRPPVLTAALRRRALERIASGVSMAESSIQIGAVPSRPAARASLG